MMITAFTLNSNNGEAKIFQFDADVLCGIREENKPGWDELYLAAKEVVEFDRARFDVRNPEMYVLANMVDEANDVLDAFTVTYNTVRKEYESRHQGFHLISGIIPNFNSRRTRRTIARALISAMDSVTFSSRAAAGMNR